MKYNELNFLIIEDEPLIAEDILEHLTEMGYTNISIVYTPNDALEILKQNKIDFVLLDINLNHDISGIDIAKTINDEYQLPFIFITSYADSETIKNVKETYPVGYIMKPFNEKEVNAVIQIGYDLFYKYIGKSEEINTAAINRFASTPLTQKETEVILKIAEGKTNKQIADDLFVSLNTVKTHLKNIFVKLDIVNRSEAIILLNKAKNHPKG